MYSSLGSYVGEGCDRAERGRIRLRPTWRQDPSCSFGLSHASRADEGEVRKAIEAHEGSIHGAELCISITVYVI